MPAARRSDTSMHPPATHSAAWTFVTIHPSYLLRLRDDAEKAREYHAFVNDLRRAKKLCA